MPRLRLAAVAAVLLGLAVGAGPGRSAGAPAGRGPSVAAAVAPAEVLTRIDGPVSASAVARRVTAPAGNPAAAPCPTRPSPSTPPTPVVVLEGAGKVTLSGAGQHRILYMNTCDQAQIWTTSHCQDQDQPQLTIQHLSFTQGNSTGDLVEGGGGGAVFVRGGRVKVVDSVFTANQCDPTGRDNRANEGGGAIFFVSNDRTGELRIMQSQLIHNISRGFETQGFPGIFFLGQGGPQVTSSTIE